MNFIYVFVGPQVLQIVFTDNVEIFVSAWFVVTNRSCHRQNSVQKLKEKPKETPVFLWILRNFQEHLFYKALPGDCFCQWVVVGPRETYFFDQIIHILVNRC